MSESRRREFEHLLYTSADKLATITFNRPERLNAMSFPAKHDFKAALELAAGDDTVRVLALRGQGRAFCTGIDLKDLSTGKIGADNFALWEQCLRLIETMDKLVIALMHGYALGGGVQLGLACDLRVGTPTSRYGLPAAKEGLLPGLAVWRLAKCIGMGRAKELALWGEPIDGTEALRIGLVTRLVPDEQRDAEFDALVARTVAGASQGARATKRAMNLVATADFEAALAIYMDLQRQGLGSADFAEAMSAYREKRNANWG
jgi:enoyl-CoA hydratase/carnithine racemase